MTCALFVIAFALLNLSASVHAAMMRHPSDCKTGTCAPQIDDETAMIESRAKISHALQSVEADLMLLMQASGVGHSLQVECSESMSAIQRMIQRMAKSTEIAVTKMIAGNHSAMPPEFFDPIEAQVELMRKELVLERESFQRAINIANSNVEKCNTNMQNAYATEKGSVGHLKSMHHTCRGEEQVTYDAKNASCAELAVKTREISMAAPKCLSRSPDVLIHSMPSTSDVQECLKERGNWVKASQTVLLAAKADCDSKTEKWSSKAEDCDMEQAKYEFAVCSHADKLEKIRSTLDTCYSDAISIRTSIESTLRVEEKYLEGVWASAKKIICFLSPFKRGDMEKVAMSDFAACKQMDIHNNTNRLNNSESDMKITYFPAVAKDTEKLHWNPISMPGDSQWVAHEYAGYTKEWLLSTSSCLPKTTTSPTAKPTTSSSAHADGDPFRLADNQTNSGSVVASANGISATWMKVDL